VTARFQVRPLGVWGHPVTESRTPSNRFSASWDDTVKLLIFEVDRLDGDLIVVQVDADPGGIRRDGMLRARARVDFPGVKVSFQSRHGPLTYATDAYDQWQENVHAVGLTLQALAEVDEFGLLKGAQYYGFGSLGQFQRTPPGAFAIPLRDRRKRVVAHTLVDLDDAHLADQPWYQLRSGYVVRTEIVAGRKNMRYLHRAVLGVGSYDEHPIKVDHIDGNRLDNRRHNLRLADSSGNGQNRGANRGRSLPRGVHYSPQCGKYLALAKLHGQRREVGHFQTVEEADRAISAWRAANMPYSADARRAHPNVGGNPDAFRLIPKARDVLLTEGDTR
jgi:hypothetical protein